VFVLTARYLTKEGSDDEVASLLREMIPHARSEPGCVRYDVNRATEDPRRFLLFEVYRDEDAFKAHTETEAFKTYVLGRIVPLLEQREREFFTPVEP
jgi:quinol monooxygenase YgiN